MKYYDNGEPEVEKRMEDELWYSDYQSLLELSLSQKEITIEGLMDSFLKEFKEIFNKEYENKEQLLRWCVLIVERHNDFLEA